MGKKILALDDDPLVLKTLNNLLTRSSYEVKCVKTGEEAESEVLSTKYDLIISDIRMPRRDGISVIRRLKEISVEKHGLEIPFIFITGYASEEAPIDAVKLGAKDYILKPFDMEELLKSIQKYAL